MKEVSLHVHCLHSKLLLQVFVRVCVESSSIESSRNFSLIKAFQLIGVQLQDVEFSILFILFKLPNFNMS